MEKILILKTVEQIKAISHPYRMEILRTFSRNIKQPCSIKMIADEMGETPSKLHYHIKELEKNGLLEVVDTREINGILEKLYLPTAERITVEKDLVQGEECMAEAQRFLCDLLDGAKEQILHHSTGSKKKVSVYSGVIHLEPERAEEFYEKFNALAEEYMDADKPGVIPHNILMIYYPHGKKK